MAAHTPQVIKTWDIAEVGWQVFDSEVRILTQNRTDVELKAASPGKLMLIEKPLRGMPKQAQPRKVREQEVRNGS